MPTCRCCDFYQRGREETGTFDGGIELALRRFWQSEVRLSR
jgi:hypothetical protein